MLTLIFDLDNTIYPVSAISKSLFPPLFTLLDRPEYGLDEQTRREARRQIMRRPFQKVAEEFRFPEQLVRESLDLLRTLTVDVPMSTFEDYPVVRDIPAQRFLVTTGFPGLQESKIDRLGIRDDFREIFIIDPDRSPFTKKDIFGMIREKYRLDPSGMVVVGDDPDSEIRGASELRIRSFLLDPHDEHRGAVCSYRGRRLGELVRFLEAVRTEPNERS